MDNKKELFRKIREFQKICWNIDLQPDECKMGASKWKQIYLSRKISIWITYFLRNSNITPNQITALWVFLGALGAFLFVFDDYWKSVAAVLLLYASWILDNVDGELARFKKQFSIEGNLLDMLGHQVIFPLVFGCLTFSLVNQGGSRILIFLGFLATALVTPLTKMQENVWLLLCIKTLAGGDKLEEIKQSRGPGIKTKIRGEKRDYMKSMTSFISKLFTHFAILYLLILAVVLDLKHIYLAFYGIGIPLVFIPKYLVRARELRKIAAAPFLLEEQFRSEWLDS